MSDSDNLFVGHTVDPVSHEHTGSEAAIEASDLTTHGVIVGMTGSGKTGLGVILIEEALAAGIPTLVIDPKGDMGNLALTFPAMRAEDFEPWVPEPDPPTTRTDAAAATAETWQSGLERSGIDAERLEAQHRETAVTIYTPGSAAGVPLNVVGSLRAPVDADPEALTDEIESFTTGLLRLVGIDADPLADREHILVANLIHHAWGEGRDLDLATLIAAIQDPPMRKLGVIDLETFFSADDRLELALRLNGLAASPAFATWAMGADLDIDALVATPTGTGATKAAVISIAHLSDEERQFVVSLVLSKLVTWMRSRPGRPDLGLLVYMDEVMGFVPPTAQPPAKKPILTLLKQARAYGVGLVLSTQNPVDLDYKAMSNAGTWMIGRLQTERDKARLLDGMRSAAGDTDLSTIDATISGLAKREFLLHSTHTAGPQVFSTRWAISYLAGPLTRDQISRLTAHDGADGHAGPAAGPTAAAPGAGPADTGDAGVAGDGDRSPALADDETIAVPPVAEGVRVAYLHPSAPWGDAVGATPGGRRLVPALLVQATALFDERRADLRHEMSWNLVLSPLSDHLDPDTAVMVETGDRDLVDDPPDGAVHVLVDARLDQASFWRSARARIRDHLHRSATVELFHNPELKLWSRPGETREDFARRCDVAADEGADADADSLRDTLRSKSDRVRDAIAKAQDRVRELETDVANRSRDEVLSGVGDLLGGLLGGRRGTRGVLGDLRRASGRRRTRDNAEERLETARRRLGETVDDLADLEAELAESLNEILDDWEERAGAIESVVVGLEKNDIDVDDPILVWVPTD
ncbi:MAG: DUF87 domain-containing protein [Acidimicrobiales bacterium]